MFTVSEVLPVNIAGAPVLTRSDVWNGLVAKARDAVPFVRAMQRCDVIDEISPLQFDREIELHGETLRERITLDPQTRVTFERLSGNVLGTIQNIIEDVDGALFLRFTFTLNVNGMANGSPEERAYADRMKASYLDAVRTTLETIRNTAG